MVRERCFVLLAGDVDCCTESDEVASLDVDMDTAVNVNG